MTTAQTVPVTGPESAVRIRAASPLVLLAMSAGLTAADAIALVEARAAESVRLSNLRGSL